MKRKLILSMLLLVGISAFAQEKAIKEYGFWDNWFIQLQGGANYTFGEDSKKAPFLKMLTPKVQVSVGKFFSPYAGLRASVAGWKTRQYNARTQRLASHNYYEANLDGLFNLSTIFAPHSDNSKFGLYAIAGIGYTHGVRNENLGVITNDYFSPRLGLMADVRLSSVVSLNLEVTGNLLDDSFNGRVSGSKYASNVGALLGVTFRLPQQGFERVPLYANNSGEIDELNRIMNDRRREITRLNAENADLKNRLGKKPATVVKEVKVNGGTETVLNAVVVFKLGSAKLEDNQTINIYNAAKYLKENPDVNVIVTGYADKSTGNATINQRLSEARAETVANILANQYGIASSRITKQASGDREQPFETPEWNRVVIFTVR